MVNQGSCRALDLLDLVAAARLFSMMGYRDANSLGGSSRYEYLSMCLSEYQKEGDDHKGDKPSHGRI